MNRNTRIALIAGAVVIAVVAFIVASSGGGSSKKSKSGVAKIVVRNQAPVGGIKDISVAKGGTVRFAVTSDSAQEIHVHGYNFHKDVTPGGTVRFAFPAKIDGQFVIELEKPGIQIARLKVTP